MTVILRPKDLKDRTTVDQLLAAGFTLLVVSKSGKRGAK